ncbi:hypothetical protein GDO86_000686 [Hymenochirus boettgeri]|uniref:Uncharacterized protein n=1 Tax=Hymenochirus boettgeri TaxID=247094 RepID=A0A8T2KID0_9PIPI|nr:hypothetical protein GDO86_000686 [Hymenochirus boettgeri]
MSTMILSEQYKKKSASIMHIVIFVRIKEYNQKHSTLLLSKTLVTNACYSFSNFISRLALPIYSRFLLHCFLCPLFIFLENVNLTS